MEEKGKAQLFIGDPFIVIQVKADIVQALFCIIIAYNVIVEFS